MTSPRTRLELIYRASIVGGSMPDDLASVELDSLSPWERFNLLLKTRKVNNKNVVSHTDLSLRTLANKLGVENSTNIKDVIIRLNESFKPRVWNGHTRLVYSVCALDATRIASGSADKTIKIWNVETGTCTRTLKGHTDWVDSVCALDANRIASGSADKTIRIYLL